MAPGRAFASIGRVVDSDQWLLANDRYLEEVLTWVRARLDQQINQLSQPSLPVPQDDHGPANDAVVAIDESNGPQPQPALITLQQQLGLAPFETKTLLLCAAMEFDTRTASLCARAQDASHMVYPTFALALTLFDDPAWDVVSPDRPLRYWRLIEILRADYHPLISSPLCADERIVNYIKGLNHLDSRLSLLLTPLNGSVGQTGLPRSHQELVETVAHRVRHLPASNRRVLIQLLGSDSISKQSVVLHVAAALGRSVYRLPADLIPQDRGELETLARLWFRESMLSPVVLYVDAQQASPDILSGGPGLNLNRFLMQSGGIIFLDVRDKALGIDQSTITLDVAKPTRVEQQIAWRDVSQDLPQPSLQQLAAQFNLPIPAIYEIGESALAAAADGPDIGELFWETCLGYTRPGLDTLAQRLLPRATWDDIVLPENETRLLHEIADQVRQRGTVYEEWGFRNKMNRGFGITALFAGESGTGKTMAAEVIANDLRLNLFRIDLSGVVSKYVGETEKNLRHLFDAAEDGGALLFFDEADALFGKRSQVSDSHDRYANIEINYLLQRLEVFEGLAILATNRRSDLDEAFTRRLRFIVNFPVPSPQDRERIWLQVFPAATPVAELDYDRLARFGLTGGNIHNAALNAAFLAAREGIPVNMRLVLRAVRTEFLKIDRLIKESDFAWEA